MKTRMEVVFAYATSRYAVACGVAETGGFVVTEGFNRVTCARGHSTALVTHQAFATEAAAQAWIEAAMPIRKEYQAALQALTMALAEKAEAQEWNQQLAARAARAALKGCPTATGGFDEARLRAERAE